MWNCRTHDTLLRCKFVWLWWSFSSQSHFCQWGRVKVSQALQNFSGCETRVCSSWLQKNVRKEKCNIGRSNCALAPANCSLHPTNVIVYTNFHTFPGFGQNDKAFRSGLQFPEHLAEGLTVKLFRVFFVEHERCQEREIYSLVRYEAGLWQQVVHNYQKWS